MNNNRYFSHCVLEGEYSKGHDHQTDCNSSGEGLGCGCRLIQIDSGSNSRNGVDLCDGGHFSCHEYSGTAIGFAALKDSSGKSCRSAAGTGCDVVSQGRRSLSQGRSVHREEVHEGDRNVIERVSVFLNSVTDLELGQRSSTDTWGVQGDSGDRRSVGDGTVSIGFVQLDTAKFAFWIRAQGRGSRRRLLTTVELGGVASSHTTVREGSVAVFNYSGSEVRGGNSSRKERSGRNWWRNIGSSWVKSDFLGKLEGLEEALDHCDGEVESEDLVAFLNDCDSKFFGEGDSSENLVDVCVAFS